MAEESPERMNVRRLMSVLISFSLRNLMETVYAQHIVCVACLPHRRFAVQMLPSLMAVAEPQAVGILIKWSSHTPALKKLCMHLESIAVHGTMYPVPETNY